MPPRRTHTKSRNGCAKCKRRRVKCDEVHPACGNCINHAIECDFSTLSSPNVSSATLSPPASTQGGSIPEAPPPSATRSDISPVPVPQSYPAFIPLPENSAVPSYAPEHRLALLTPVDSPRWSMADMELMHHYTLEGPGFLTTNEAMYELWRTFIPRVAFGDKGGCALHAILAVSSLHLAFLEPENRSSRLITATAHYDQAVRTISCMVPNICKDSCESLFVSSTFIVVFTTASPLIPGSASSENDPWAIPEWVPLIRGVHSILKETWSWVQTGILSPLLKVRLYDDTDWLSDDTDNALNALYRLCTDTSEPDVEEIKDTEISSTYFGAIHELRKSFTNYSNPQHQKSNKVSLIFLWPICVSDKYVALLGQRRPRALIIFAHYCALLKWLEVSWWVRGRAEYDLVRIEKSIHDHERWKKWLEWPIKIVRGENAPAAAAATA